MFVLADIPADYSKVQMRTEQRIFWRSEQGKEKNVIHFSGSNFNLSSFSYSYSQNLNHEGRIPTSARLKKAMYKKSSKAIGSILSNY